MMYICSYIGGHTPIFHCPFNDFCSHSKPHEYDYCCSHHCNKAFEETGIHYKCILISQILIDEKSNGKKEEFIKKEEFSI